MQKPYKSCVSIRSHENVLDHLYGATGEDAQEFVQRGLAVAIDEGKCFIGKIQLKLPLRDLKEHLRPAKRRPRPPVTQPMSSTGDAGRGMTLLGRYRIVHMERQAALGATR